MRLSHREEHCEEKEDGEDRKLEVLESKLEDKVGGEEREDDPDGMKCYHRDLFTTVVPDSGVDNSEEAVVRSILALKCSSWDPITEDAVFEGAFVLADSALCADKETEVIEECARGIVLSCDQKMLCKIGFVNKGENCLRHVSITLPDDRVLQPIHDQQDGYDTDTWSKYSE